jgi:hypothetical protein
MFNNMEISHLIEQNKNLIHVGNIHNKNGKWKVDYVCDSIIQTKNNGRIYLIVVDNIIYKIGCSESKGGIKNTFNSYQGGLGGSPSLRTFGIHKLIQEQLDLGKKIQIYAIFIDPIEVVIHGLVSCMHKTTYPQIKEMEHACREDYKKVYGKYPLWNFQENYEQFPEHIKNAFKEYITK